ncbi:carboxypeptidase-like regulatory domain-containing protein [Hymenobacter sp. CRA2]|uniref:carboxypeptidase-like regulatory domain-containing protein n=1 Tax=Hymenobacter sp. CRA2 TaxID=1955620 RepID=UPI00098ECA54|nr:carboxypeptidase-like regulatory domain-containing protein [Hymenobacter sp. CRA2]OON70846.1 hypothetical protein B0919_02220 [Hymenobacter sp. CRA2]
MFTWSLASVLLMGAASAYAPAQATFPALVSPAAEVAGPSQKLTACTLPDTTAWKLQGRILDAYTQQPYPAASVWLKHLAIGAVSDEQGYFVLELTADQLAEHSSDSLLVQAAAFRPHAQPLTFLALHPDSVFSVALERDPAINATAPLPYKHIRRHEARTGQPSTVRRVLGDKR